VGCAGLDAKGGDNMACTCPACSSGEECYNKDDGDEQPQLCGRGGCEGQLQFLLDMYMLGPVGQES